MIIESTTLERLEVLVKSKQSPIASPPEFSITTDINGEPDGWVAGTWDGTWDSVTGEVLALTPRLGVAGDLVLPTSGTVLLRMRWTRGDETLVRRVTALEVS